MELHEIKEYITDQGGEDTMVFENPAYESAFIGLTQDNIAVYDYDLMVEYLIKHDEMTEEEAHDYISYNTLRSLPYYQNSPIVLFKTRD
jgi:hypothetical protein